MIPRHQFAASVDGAISVHNIKGWTRRAAEWRFRRLIAIMRGRYISMKPVRLPRNPHTMKPFTPSPEYAAAFTFSENAAKGAATAAATLKQTVATLAATMGIPERGAMGLTPDAIKAHPEYKHARTTLERALSHSRRVSAAFVREYADEYRQHRASSPNPYRLTL